MSEEIRTRELDDPLPYAYHFLGVIAILLAVIYAPFYFGEGNQNDWVQETRTIKETITSPCDYCSIQAEPDASFGYTIRVQYSQMDRARILVYESPTKTLLLPFPMTKFYDSLVYGPYDQTFTMSGCGTTFIAVYSLFTKEGTWMELKPRMMCL